MKNFKTFLLLVAVASFTMPACKKYCMDDKVIKKHGLPLSGAQEVPAKTTKATGKANVSYNKATKVLSYTVTWDNLSGIPTGAHIHGPAARGTNAGIKHDFFAAIPKTISGSYSGSVTVDGVAIVEESLLMGMYYFNFHTPTNPGGEIRGQIEFY